MCDFLSISRVVKVSKTCVCLSLCAGTQRPATLARCLQGTKLKPWKSAEQLNSSSPARDWAPQLGSISLKLAFIWLSLAEGFVSLSKVWVCNHIQNWRSFARALLWKLLTAPLTGSAASAASILSLADTFDFGSCLHFPEKSMYISYFWIAYI